MTCAVVELVAEGALGFEMGRGIDGRRGLAEEPPTGDAFCGGKSPDD